MKPQVFNFYDNQVRFVMIDNKKYAVGKDSAEAIGYKNTRKAIKDHVKDKYKREERIVTPFGEQEMTLISEPGLYQLAAQSKLPKAEPFQDWLFEQVLPQINANGEYNIQKDSYMIDDPVKRAERWIEEAKERKELAEQNEIMKPKAIFADAVSVSKTSILVGELAKLLKQNGIDIGAQRLFKWMREKGYLIKRKGNDYNTPTQRSMEMKLFKVKETTINHSSGNVTISKTTKVTGRGQIYFINKFKNMNKPKTA